MDFNKGHLYIDMLKAGTSEESIIEQFNIDAEELYAVVAYSDQNFARSALKHFCLRCANDICFGWPVRDEALCPSRGFEPNCPLKK